MICTLSIFFCDDVQGQRRDELKDLQEDIATLKKDVGTLGERQQQIINQLNELKKSLPSRSDAPSEAALPASVVLHGEPFMGDSAARVVVIEYADFECRFCMKYKTDVYPKIVKDYVKTGKVKYVFRAFPFPTQTRAVWAARATRCAGEQGKFWEMHDVLFTEQTSVSEKTVLARAEARGVHVGELGECLAGGRYFEEILQGISEAQKIGIERTPTFLLGRASSEGAVVKISKAIRGTYPYEIFKSDLDKLLSSEPTPPGN